MTTIRSTILDWSRTDAVTSLPLRRAVGVLAFALATALAAKVAIPLPGTPIPFTFQPMVVLMAGALLGGRLGMFSQLAYLAAGVAGLPVFAAGGGALYLLGPTGGYLLAYPLAAFVAGQGRGGVRSMLAVLGGLGVVYAGGLSWLALSGDLDFAVAWGLRPFLLADLVKVLLVILVAGQLRGRALQLFGR